MSDLSQQRLEQEDAEDAAGLAAESQEPMPDDPDADVAPTQPDDSELAADAEQQTDTDAATRDDVHMSAALPLVRSFTLPLLHKTPVSSRSYLRLDAPPTPLTAHDGSCSPSRRTTPLSLRTLARLPQLFRFPMGSPSATSASSMASPSAMSIVSPPPAEAASTAAAVAAAVPASSPSSSSSSSSQRHRPQRSFTTVQARPPLTHQHPQLEATAGSLSAQHSTEAAAAGVSSSHKRVRSTDAESDSAVDVPASAAAAPANDMSMCVPPTKSASVAATATATSALPADSILPCMPELEPQILVGPVIGKVDATTARVLLEINVAARITATLTPQTRWFRPPFDAATSTAAATVQSSPSPISSPQSSDAETGMRSPIKKQRTEMTSNGSAVALNSPLVGGVVHTQTLHLQPFHPTIFAFRDLAPDTIYLVTFAPASESEPAFDPALLLDRTGILRTHSTDPACPPNFVAFSCDCASEVGRDNENMWVRLYNEQCVAPSPTNQRTVFLHIGDQVYADSAFAKGETILAANFPAEPNPAEATTAKGSSDSPDESVVDEYAELTLPQKLRLIYDAYGESTAAHINPEARTQREQHVLARHQGRSTSSFCACFFAAEIYRHTWSDSPTRLVLATGSHLMQLDDHELRNDFGSFVPTPMDRLIASQARKAFHVYQRALWDDQVAVASSDTYDALQLSSLECSFHVFGRVGLLIMDNRSCRTLDPTCSVFPKEKYEEERRMMIAAGMEPPQEVVAAAAETSASSSSYRPPHAHAYFGAEQWQRLYSYFPPALAGGASPATHLSSSTPSASGVVSDSVSVLLVVNPSPAFFLGSAESERLIPQSCLVDKLGLGLHPEEQGCYLRLFERWKYGGGDAVAASASTSASFSDPSFSPSREVLFLGGDSHFGMTSFIWRVDEALLASLDPPLAPHSDPRLVGSGSPRGPSYWPIPDHPAVRVLFKQVLCSALSSRRPRYSSFMLWKKSLFAKHALHAKHKQTQQDAGTADVPPPYYLTHERLLYAHNFVCISVESTASPPSVHTQYVLSGAHRAELEVRKQQKAEA